MIKAMSMEIKKENGDNRFSIIAKAIIAIIEDMIYRLPADCPPLASLLYI